MKSNKVSTKELDLIREFILYAPGSGSLYSKKERHTCPIGTKLGSISCGYLQIKIKQKKYYAHRIAWFLFHGEWPKDQVDHIDGNRLNNKIENLRIVDRYGNNHNRPQHRAGLLLGTHQLKNGKWRARTPSKYLNHQTGIRITLGYYKTMEEAGQAVINYCSRQKEEDKVE